MGGVLEELHEGYWAALDRWLLDPANLDGMGARGPATATRQLLRAQQSGLWLVGVVGDSGEPAGISYGAQWGPDAIELHVSVFEGAGPWRYGRYLRACKQSVKLAFEAHPWCQRVTTAVSRPELQRILMCRLPGAVVAGSAKDWSVGPFGRQPVTFGQLTREAYEQWE